MNLLLAMLLSLTSVAQVQLNGLNSSPPVNPNPTSFFGALDRRLMVFFGDRPFLLNVKDIDRMVGDPRTLEPSTAAKLLVLPVRIRLRIYSILSDNLSAISILSSANQQPAVSSLQLDEKTTLKLIDGVQDTLGAHFRDQEMADLGVYILSQFPFFPKNDYDWHKWKQFIVASDIWLALAYVMAMGSADQGVFKLTGWLYEVPGERFRVGWYGSARHLGFSGRPDLSSGVRAAGPMFDFTAGGVHRVGAGATDERTALEVDVREHFLETFGRPKGFDLSVHANLRYVTDHADPNLEHKGWAGVDIFGRKLDIFGQRDLNLMGSSQVRTDFLHRTTSGASLGLENGALGAAGALNFSMVNDDQAPTSYKIGLIMDGTLDGDPHEIEHEVERYASWVRSDLEYLERLDSEFQNVERGLGFNKGYKVSHSTELQILENLRLRAKWIEKGEKKLLSRVDIYRILWRKHCSSRGLVMTQALDENGPLDISIIRRVLKRLVYVR